MTLFFKDTASTRDVNKARAIAGRVAYVPGVGFYSDGQGRRNLRLSYSLPEPERIREGVRRLAGVLADFVDGADVGMVEGGSSSSLAPKAFQRLRVLG